MKRKRTAEEEAAAQHLKGISAESKKRLLEVSALSLTGTALEASRGVGGRAKGQGWRDRKGPSQQRVLSMPLKWHHASPAAVLCRPRCRRRPPCASWTWRSR